MNNLISLIPCSLLLVVSTVIAKEPIDYTDMKKKLTIMTNIMKSSTFVQDGRQVSGIRSVDTTYLKGQGVVFIVKPNAPDMYERGYHYSFSRPIAPPAPPIFSSSRHSKTFDSEAEREVEIEMQRALSEAESTMSNLHYEREQYRELHEEERDLHYDIRDIDRDIKDVSFQSKRADKESKKEFLKQLDNLNAQKAELVRKKKELTVQISKLKEAQKKEQIALEKKRNTFYNKLSFSLTEALCLYGNGLRKLPKDEHVSLIIRSGGNKLQQGYKDKVYVFNKRDIIECSNERISIDKLINKGNSYQF